MDRRRAIPATTAAMSKRGADSQGESESRKSESPVRRRSGDSPKKCELQHEFNSEEESPRKAAARKNREEKEREFKKLRERRCEGWTEDCKYCDSQRKLLESSCFACEKNIEETREEAEARRKAEDEDPISNWNASTFKNAVFDSVHRAQRIIESDVKIIFYATLRQIP